MAKHNVLIGKLPGNPRIDILAERNHRNGTTTLFRVWACTDWFHAADTLNEGDIGIRVKDRIANGEAVQIPNEAVLAYESTAYWTK